jgi:hypothetical protein
MANEIAQSHVESGTLYALVYSEPDKYIYNVATAALEAVGTWDNTRIRDCAIDMLPQGDMHFADFPSTINITAQYKVQVRVNASGTPGTEDITDWIKSQGQISWDGVLFEEITLGGLFSQGSVVNQFVPAPDPVEPRSRIYI